MLSAAEHTSFASSESRNEGRIRAIDGVTPVANLVSTIGAQMHQTMASSAIIVHNCRGRLGGTVSRRVTGDATTTNK